jgi:4'-phosphopantetheinyl transferase EntD
VNPTGEFARHPVEGRPGWHRRRLSNLGGVIASLLPASVATAECRDDPTDAFLLPGEEAAVARAVAQRRREYTTVRHCARRALAALGLPPAAIVPGPRREPVWPAGVIGSMTHCSGYRAAAVALATHIVSLGIDAEEHAPLPVSVDTMVTLPEEREQLRTLAASHPDTEWGRVLFSAKESVYKTWFPLTGRWLGFEEARLRLDPGAGTFTADLLVDGPVVDGVPVHAFTGRWLVRDGLVLTAIALRRG